ncbi:MAG: ABC transporter ATP-binding protein [Clostridia bacterium]|nr:ABC transporter ATP-binding protein [Clostridia bacterium]
MDYAIRIKNLTKAYKIYSSPLRRVFDSIFHTKGYNKFVALDDITVDIPKGEVVGILGKNGSGKSTLLKIITGVAKQTSGEVVTEGKISAMLELTSGFDPELTGIENIYLKALSMGISKAEITKRLDDIKKFADIGDYINRPVRTYSSGMKSRLGFAVSVNVDPDILVVDEVLAVGDDIFRLKCIEKMKQFRREGKTILFVSHSLFTVKAFCTKGLWINEGKMMDYGDLGPVVLKYEDYLKKEKAKLTEQTPNEEQLPQEKKDILQVSKFAMLNGDGEKTTEFKHGEEIKIKFDYEVKRPIDKLNFGFTLRDAEERLIFMSDKQSPDNLIDGTVGKHSLEITVNGLNLLSGTYMLSGELWDNESTFFVGFSNKRKFTVSQDNYIGSGIVSFPYTFTNK